MKHLTAKLLAISALALAGSAMADVDPVVNDIMGAQLNPIMNSAFSQANTAITIRHHPFVVVSPATCSGQTCSVVLDYMHNDPKSFVVLHEKNEGKDAVVKAKVITVFPQELYQLSYQMPWIKNSALNVTDIHRIYR